jgi:hypothetical protein
MQNFACSAIVIVLPVAADVPFHASQPIEASMARLNDNQYKVYHSETWTKVELCCGGQPKVRGRFIPTSG